MAAATTRSQRAAAGTQPGTAPGRSRSWARRRTIARAIFLVPALAYVVFAFLLPTIYNLILSFQQTSPATISSLAAPFAGLENYRSTLEQTATQSALLRTLTFTVLSLIFQFLIGFGLALLFNLTFPLRRLARSLIIVPWLLPFLITGTIFRFLFQLEGGAVNQILADLHLIAAGPTWRCS
jgi:multiple sugar transport system permease protein